MSFTLLLAIVAALQTSNTFVLLRSADGSRYDATDVFIRPIGGKPIPMERARGKGLWKTSKLGSEVQKVEIHVFGGKTGRGVKFVRKHDAVIDITIEEEELATTRKSVCEHWSASPRVYYVVPRYAPRPILLPYFCPPTYGRPRYRPYGYPHHLPLQVMPRY